MDLGDSCVMKSGGGMQMSWGEERGGVRKRRQRVKKNSLKKSGLKGTGERHEWVRLREGVFFFFLIKMVQMNT